MATEGIRRFWRYSRALLAPLLIWLLLVGALVPPVLGWLHSEERYDEAAMQEWIEEARNNDKTLADLVGEYVESLRALALQREKLGPRPPDLVIEYQDARERAVVWRNAPRPEAATTTILTARVTS